jgi:Glycoside-hydrolase family GH114
VATSLGRLMGALTIAAMLLATGAWTSHALPIDTARQVNPPPVNAKFDYQLGGAYPPPSGVTAVTRDRHAHPVAGTYSICYVNAFQTQPGALPWWRHHHPRLLLRTGSGQLVHDPGWPGEVLLDTSTALKRSRLARVIGVWIAGCAQRGFKAVEPDNLDSFTRSRGLLTRDGALKLSARLARRAHYAGLAIAQKNLAGLHKSPAHSVGFDFAVAEDCQRYHECANYLRAYGRHVIEIEYADNGLANFKHACSARGARISIVYRDRLLRPRGQPGYRYRAC